MTNKTDRMALKALAIAAGMIFILFVGLFVGYLWGADAAHKDNAAEASMAAPNDATAIPSFDAKGKRLGS